MEIFGCGSNFYIQKGSDKLTIASETGIAVGSTISSWDSLLTITSAGRVGIGATTVDTALHIETAVPTIRLEDSDASGTPLIDISGAGGELKFDVDSGGEASGSNIIFSSDGSERLKYNSSTGVWECKGSLDMTANGNRIDLDTDNDTSIRASADDTMVFELGGEDYFTMYNTGSSNTTATWNATTVDRGITLELKVPSSANTGWMNLSFKEGAGDGTANDMAYQFSYGPSSNYFRFQSQDTDGSAATADIYRILDGQLTIDANTTWDANVFDYVCGECGRHEAEKFECCGPVAWHDDVALMDEVIHGVGKNKNVVEKLEKLGVVNTYGTLGTDKPELYTSLQKMPWFLMSGMVQMSNRIDELESRLEMN